MDKKNYVVCPPSDRLWKRIKYHTLQLNFMGEEGGGQNYYLYLSICVVIHLQRQLLWQTLMSFSFPIIIHFTAWIKYKALARPANMYYSKNCFHINVLYTRKKYNEEFVILNFIHSNSSEWCPSWGTISRSATQEFSNMLWRQWLIIMFTRACHWSLSWARWIQSISHNPY
jgi:hypothetical protein